MKVNEISVGALYTSTTIRKVLEVTARPAVEFPTGRSGGTVIAVHFRDVASGAEKWVTLDSFATWAARRSRGLVTFEPFRMGFSVLLDGELLGRVTGETQWLGGRKTGEWWTGRLTLDGQELRIEADGRVAAQRRCRGLLSGGTEPKPS